MKHSLLILSIVIFSQLNLVAQKQSAYFQVTTSTESMGDAINIVKTALQNSGFKVIGEYNPRNSDNLAVVCYTRPDLEKIALSFSDRGSLAAALKIGFKKEGNSVNISMLNPMYLFYGYFIEGVDKHEKDLVKISDDAKDAMKKVGTDFTPFGGELSKKELQKYHY
ncbi:MAG: hypothetical protein L3J54_08320, partial [Draconibacterium sp.]|nr:hypothetical protein [Draconibacterium sp.]